MFNFFVSQFKNPRLVIKYATSGGIAFIAQMGMLIFLVEYFQMWHIYAVLCAFVFAATIAFSLQKFWTFRDHSLDGAHFQMAMYVVLACVALSLNVLLMYIFVDILGIWYVISQIITIGLVAMVTFLCNKNIIFNRKLKLFRREPEASEIAEK